MARRTVGQIQSEIKDLSKKIESLRQEMGQQVDDCGHTETTNINWSRSPENRDEVFERVRDVLIGSLAIEFDDVVPNAKLSYDLGAESIDYLDISFQLERACKIVITKYELTPENLFSRPEFVCNGKVTPEGLAELEKRIPFADLSVFKDDPDVNRFRLGLIPFSGG